MKFKDFDKIQSMEKISNMEWKKNFKYGMKDFEGYKIWKIPIPFHFIASPG